MIQLAEDEPYFQNMMQLEEDSLQQASENMTENYIRVAHLEENGIMSDSYGRNGQLGSVDTGINTAVIQAMNEAVNYEEDYGERGIDLDDADEDRILLYEETQNMGLNDTYTQALLESQPTNSFKNQNVRQTGVGGFSEQMSELQRVQENQDSHRAAQYDMPFADQSHKQSNISYNNMGDRTFNRNYLQSRVNTIQTSNISLAQVSNSQRRNIDLMFHQ